MKFFTKSKICKKKNKTTVYAKYPPPPPRKEISEQTTNQKKQNKTKRTHKENAGVPLVTLLNFCCISKPFVTYFIFSNFDFCCPVFPLNLHPSIVPIIGV